MSKMNVNEFITILDTFNCLEGNPKSYNEVVDDSKNLYNCYIHGFKNHQITLELFKRIVWDVFEYYENETNSEEYIVARKFIKETYL